MSCASCAPLASPCGSPTSAGSSSAPRPSSPNSEGSPGRAERGARPRSCRRAPSALRGERSGRADLLRRRDLANRDGQLPAEVLDRPPVQLARAGLADPHPDAGLAQGERVPVVAGEDLALAYRQARQRALHPSPQVLGVEAFADIVVDGAASEPAVEELVERHGRYPARLAPRRDERPLPTPVGASKVVDAADLVQDGPPDPQRRVALERDATIGLEAIDGVDEPDERRRLQVIGASDRSDGDVHCARNPRGHRHVVLDQCATRQLIAVQPPSPEAHEVHVRVPLRRRRPTDPQFESSPSPQPAPRTLGDDRGRVNPRSCRFAIPIRKRLSEPSGAVQAGSTPPGDTRSDGGWLWTLPGPLGHSISRLLSARTTAWVRSVAPSLAIRVWTPFLTVSSARTIARAISLFV